ncbi:MAG: NADH:flavin oxidoreductase [Sporomusaceae bacterium]|nr:NADH:flavin oxidoreductase [Sporomusaceae bacterium]
MNRENLDLLFQPVTLGNLSLSNRIVMAPMTRGFSPKGIPGADVAAYYRRRAENETGLIITEGTLINHPAAAEGLGRPNFFGQESLDGWAKVVEEVHQAGGKIIPQLWHVGMARQLHGQNPNPDVAPVGPSGLDVISGEQIAKSLTRGEIQEIVAAFGEAARQAKRLGFDGIEIHGAHGYLIDQFFWANTNQRDDEYGGDLVARTRFATEIIKACRSAVGDDFPIVFRFSQWKLGHYQAKMASDPAELAAFLAPLSAAGVDIFHASTRRYWEPEFVDSPLNLAGWTKKLTGKPTITVGSVGLDTNVIEFFTEGKGANHSSLAPLMARLEQNEFDLVAVGRALLADPAWTAKIHQGRAQDLILFSKGAETTLS